MVKASDMDVVVTVVVPRMTVVAIEVVSMLSTAVCFSHAAGFSGTTGCKSGPILYISLAKNLKDSDLIRRLTSSWATEEDRLQISILKGS